MCLPAIRLAGLAARNKAHFPNESPEYRQARNALLAEEIELRRQIERVAGLRRALPPGGGVSEDYTFEGQDRTVHLSQLFGEKDTLVIYSRMFGPQRQRPCPMCTSLLTSWEGTARNLRERVALAVTARSPIEHLLDFQKERGWQNLQIYSDTKGDYTRAYVNGDDDSAHAIRTALAPSAPSGPLRPGLHVCELRHNTVRDIVSGTTSPRGRGSQTKGIHCGRPPRVFSPSAA